MVVDVDTLAAGSDDVPAVADQKIVLHLNTRAGSKTIHCLHHFQERLRNCYSCLTPNKDSSSFDLQSVQEKVIGIAASLEQASRSVLYMSTFSFLHCNSIYDQWVQCVRSILEVALQDSQLEAQVPALVKADT